MDLNPVLVPDNEYLHIINININMEGDSQPNFDKFIELCKTFYIFVGADSGISDILSYRTDINVIIKILPDKVYSPFAKMNNVKVARYDTELIEHIDRLYI
jgi:hypothetical protein